MPVLRNIGSLAVCAFEARETSPAEIKNAALAWEGDKILWAGEEAKLPGQYREHPRVDAQGCLVVPGLIDCHTHLAFAGWRADEFEQRLRGISYLEIAKRGGGILSTVASTRAASEELLIERCQQFLTGMLRLGVTTVECKSGYGLSLESELKILRVYKRLSAAQPLDIIPTLLAAHTFPAEYRENREGYIRLICEEIIPAVAKEKLAKFCDIFVERSAFSSDEARRILSVAQKAGMKLKLHVDQLSDGEGATLAAELGASSADHLEHISTSGIAALEKSGTVAVALPFASIYTKERPLDARALVDAGVTVAVATDFNPGSAPTYHLPLAMMLGCTLCGLTPIEALRGATIHAARALDEHSRLGSLEAGKQADFAIIDAPNVSHWLYHFTSNACKATYKRGNCVWSS